LSCSSLKVNLLDIRNPISNISFKDHESNIFKLTAMWHFWDSPTASSDPGREESYRPSNVFAPFFSWAHLCRLFSWPGPTYSSGSFSVEIQRTKTSLSNILNRR